MTRISTSTLIEGTSATVRGVMLWAAVACASACDGDDDGPVGAACAHDGDCGQLVCAADGDGTPTDLARQPLVCQREGPGALTGEACDEGPDCARGICLLAGACAAPCEDDADCTVDQRCQDVFARAGPDALHTLRACVGRIDLPRAIDIAAEPAPDPLELGTNELALDMAAERGATLYVLEPEADIWPDTMRCRPGLCVTGVRTRDDEPVVLFDAEADYEQGEPPKNPVATGDHIQPAVVLLPSGERDALSDAGYAVTLDSEVEGELLVTRIAGEPAGGRLDLNVFYVGALDWEPMGDRGPPLLSDALEVVDEILGQADIFIGEVRQIMVPGELPSRGSVLPADDPFGGFVVLQQRFGVLAELPGLLRLSAGAGNAALNLFFVADIEGRRGELFAEAAGIPGPPAMHGTGGSGIAVATDMMSGNPQGLGRTLAHEIAHYLGLFHVSESDGSVREALGDTPECRSERDTDGDGLGRADCQGFGADNLMFWAANAGAVLTEDQRAVLRASPLLH